MRSIFYLVCLTSILCGKPLDVEVSARSAILMNADTGAILYEKQPHQPSFPASTTKVATALFTLEQKKPSLDRQVTVSKEALRLKPLHPGRDVPAYWGEIDGTRMGLVQGEVVTLGALLHGLLLISGNDAANVIAESLAPSIPQFVEEMNGYLRSLGCLHTQFRNPHGIHHPEHFTTAYDMALIAKRALQLPSFRDIVSKLSYLKPKTNKHEAEEIYQFNRLLKPGKYFYSRAIGVKTGYHSQSLYTLVAAAEHEERTLIAVLLGCKEKEDRYMDAIRLFETAFAEEKKTHCFVQSDTIFTREMEGAKTPLAAHLGHSLELSFYPAEEPFCKAFLHWDPVRLPIHKGQKVGEIYLQTEEGQPILKEPLFAKDEVERTFFFALKEMFSNWFHRD